MPCDDLFKRARTSQFPVLSALVLGRETIQDVASRCKDVEYTEHAVKLVDHKVLIIAHATEHISDLLTNGSDFE